MANFAETVDRKFGEARQLYLEGNASVLAKDAVPDALRHEVIALDCEPGGEFMYLLSEGTLYATTITWDKHAFDTPDDLEVTHQLMRLRRPKNDRRRFEELTLEELAGEYMIIDSKKNFGVVFEAAYKRPQQIGAIALCELAEELSTLRVVERISQFPEL